MGGDSRITDADLHAYADGQLSRERRIEVEHHLETHPEAQERMLGYQALTEALRRRYSAVADEPVPDRLRRQMAAPARSGGGKAAAAMAWLMVGGFLGAALQSQLARPGTAGIEADLMRPAAFAHVVYTPERNHAVDVAADQEEYLVDWLSKRLHTEIRAPNLSDVGYRLVGGRLLPSTNRMAAQFMYEDAAGERITLYVRTGAWANEETAFHYAYEDGVGVFYWIDGTKGYAVSGRLDRQTLLGITTAVYRELNGPN